MLPENFKKNYKFYFIFFKNNYYMNKIFFFDIKKIVLSIILILSFIFLLLFIINFFFRFKFLENIFIVYMLLLQFFIFILLFINFFIFFIRNLFFFINKFLNKKNKKKFKYYLFNNFFFKNFIFISVLPVCGPTYYTLSNPTKVEVIIEEELKKIRSGNFSAKGSKRFIF